MMKIITTALTAITLSTNAFASEGHSCSHFDNVSRFNPTELSEFQKCVINKHEDKEAGIFGNLFWIKVGDDIVSMQTKLLRDAGSKDAAKEIIKSEIISSITDAEVTKLKSEIATLKGLVSEIPTLKSNLKAKTDALEALEMRIANATRDRTLDQVNAAKANGDHYKNTAYTPTSNKAGWDNVSDASAPRYYIGEVNGIPQYGTELRVSIGNDIISSRLDTNLARISEVVEEVFDAGYESGYEDGYADGYRDGFADGVASVQ